LQTAYDANFKLIVIRYAKETRKWIKDKIFLGSMYGNGGITKNNY
jgi:hypothetical protein